MIGFLNIYKPSLISSNAVLSIIKKQLKIKKVGHMGTLDPMAEGVLPIAIGNATRMFDYFLNKEKTYIATFEFGYETDTLDALGKIEKETNNIPSKQEVIEKINEFIGTINQMPPKYSAKNINGKRAYDLARKGVEFELNTKEVTIYEFKYITNVNNSYTFEITCSSGTYIRSICRDLAYSLNSLATMTKLIRTKSGKFNVNNSIKLDSIEYMDLENNLIDISKVFDYKHIVVDEDNAKKLKNGMTINFNNDNELVFVYFNEVNLGVGIINNNKLKLKTHF